MANLYMNALVFFLLMLSFMHSSTAQGPAITVFGTDRISKEEMETSFSKELQQLKDLYDTDRELYHTKKDTLENHLMGLGDFAYTNVQLFKSYTDEYSFILDFVETHEAGSRLNYRNIDHQHFDDQDGLLAKWNAYEDESFQLFKKGEITDYNCPVIHCLWSFNHPKLAPYLEFLTTYAPKHKDKLTAILHTSDTPEQRASAAFLLAHAELTNEDLLEVLMPGIRDPESTVRNNSMRVIYYIVRAFPDTPLNTAEIIDALDFPSFTDRNKALVILRSIPLDHLKQEDAKQLAQILMEILEKKDAHNYKNAHTVLKKLSGQAYGVDDLQSWKGWMNAFLYD